MGVYILRCERERRVMHRAKAKAKETRRKKNARTRSCSIEFTRIPVRVAHVTASPRNLSDVSHDDP